MHKAVNPAGIHPPFSNYSHGILAAGGVLHVSGQLGILEDGTVPIDAQDQAMICFGNIKRILAEAGMERRHVTRINAYVSDRQFLPAYMDARNSWVEGLDPPPASTLMIVAGFARPEFKVEVEVTASSH